MSKQFLDRYEEEEWLQNIIDQNGLAVLYGRRRVGKTTLIKEVIDNENHIYFLADQRPEEKNIRELQSQMSKKIDDSLFEQTNFNDWIELFREFVNRTDSKTVIAVDEFPYLIEQNKAIPSIFQKIWDELLKEEDISLILCGSSISMMETHVLDYESPLYGRRSGQWKMQPLKFSSFKEFYPEAGFEKKLKYYTAVDGIPAYMEKLDEGKSFEQNLKDNFYSKGTFLNQEAEFLLKQEVRKPSNYFTILQAIAEGNHSYGEIVNRTGLEKPTVTKYLSNLGDLHIVQKEHPVTQKTESRNAHYKLSDNYYQFWFNTVYPNKGMIEQQKTEKLMEKTREKIRHLVAESFEQICRQFTAQKFDIGQIGKWWHNQHEIDIVGLEENENKLFLGEVKWRNKKTGMKLLKQLEEEAEMVKWGGENRETTYLLFSKNGFTQQLEEKAEERENLELYTPKEIEDI